VGDDVRRPDFESIDERRNIGRVIGHATGSGAGRMVGIVIPTAIDDRVIAVREELGPRLVRRPTYGSSSIPPLYADFERSILTYAGNEADLRERARKIIRARTETRISGLLGSHSREAFAEHLLDIASVAAGPYGDTDACIASVPDALPAGRRSGR